MTLALVSSLMFFSGAFFAPQLIMGFFSNDPAVIRLGGIFLTICAFSYIPMALNFCLAAALRSMHEVHIPLQSNIFGIAVNTSLNYLLIFGKLGFPAMGVAGAAIATVIAQTSALLFLIFRTYSVKPDLFHGIEGIFKISKDLIKRFIIQTFTMIGKDLIWVLGMSLYMAIYARIGTDAAASMNITGVVRNLAVVLFGGIANASQILVGNNIGAGKKPKAYRYASKILKITLVLGVIFGLIIILARSIFLLPYRVSGDVVSGAAGVLLIYGVFLIFYVYNMVAVMGVMRPGGDNFFCAVMDTIAVWFIGLPLALLTGLAWKMPLAWVFGFISLQEVFKAILLTWRFRSRKWIHNLVHDI
jgi:putative MATE family efflux protein